MVPDPVNEKLTELQVGLSVLTERTEQYNSAMKTSIERLEKSIEEVKKSLTSTKKEQRAFGEKLLLLCVSLIGGAGGAKLLEFLGTLGN